MEPAKAVQSRIDLTVGGSNIVMVTWRTPLAAGRTHEKRVQRTTTKWKWSAVVACLKAAIWLTVTTFHFVDEETER